MSRSVLIFAKRSQQADESAKLLTNWLRDHNVNPVDGSQTDGKLSEGMLKDVVLAVAIGGDGTFLTLVRRLERKDLFPIMGVNLGTLGFITDVGKAEMIATVESALAKKVREETRRLLKVELWRNNRCLESVHVFNDAVLNKDARTSMLKLKVSVDGEHLSDVRCDGYVVATATGSTAYNLSAGGPLLHPEVEGVVLMPICPHALSARPIVVPQRFLVEVIPVEFSGELFLVLDGQVSYEVSQGDMVRIIVSNHSMRLIRAASGKWAKTLRTKLRMD